MLFEEIDLLKKEIEDILSENKAVEIRSIVLKDKTSIADYMIIANGNSSRHIQALSEILIDELKKKGIKNCRLEGRNSNEWKLKIVETTPLIKFLLGVAITILFYSYSNELKLIFIESGLRDTIVLSLQSL